MTDARTTDAAGASGDPSARHRLPYTVVPRRYRLHLAPDLETETFSGTVAIEAEATEALHSITLHCQELSVSSASVRAGRHGTSTDVDARPARPATVAGDPDHDDRVVLELADELAPGPLEIEMAFSGKLLEQLVGFYRSTFTDATGARHTLAVTQFEPTDARRAFPCFDEPDRKAVFSISVDVPAGMAAFSNSPVLSEEPGPRGTTRVTFADTIPMSSYLAALVVGPLDATDPVDVDGIPVRVVHVPGRRPLTAFALEVAAHALRFFSEWFGLAYPGAKLDLVAVPDFAFGAMENLGCVVCREAVLLVDPERASRLDLQRVADVVCHEIAHMWFGDLVTMRWWNGIWLNEAFASLMELLCVDAFAPQWERWVSFGTERDSAMTTDALDTTRPVEYPVGPPEDAQGMFDVLTYQKGAGVLRMLERYLGAETFRAGIRRYLANHRFANTETGDLWDALEAVSGAPVRRIMDSWVFQGGFPLVSTEGRGTALTLQRQPFRYRPAQGESAIGDGWPVPVLWRGAEPGSPPRRLLLEESPATVDTGGRPVVVNAGGWGFYRVGYDEPSRRALAEVAGSLEILERHNLLSDTWAALVAGRAGVGDVLELAEALRADPEPGVWRPVVRALEFFDRVAADEEREVLARYTRALAGPAFSAVGWERRSDDGERTATLRAELLRVLGTVGADPEIRHRCLERHDRAVRGGEALDPDLAPAVLAVVAAAGGQAEFDDFVARFRQPPTPQEGVRYLQSLGRFEDLELAASAFRIATTEARTQDGLFLVAALLANRVAGEQTWSKVEQSWDELQARFPASLLPTMLEPVRALCRQPGLAARVKRFLGAHPLPSGQRTVEQAVEQMEINVALAGRLAGSLGRELSSRLERLVGP
jgi:puromycin-sensitive aminopeptidase